MGELKKRSLLRTVPPAAETNTNHQSNLLNLIWWIGLLVEGWAALAAALLVGLFALLVGYGPPSGQWLRRKRRQTTTPTNQRKGMNKLMKSKGKSINGINGIDEMFDCRCLWLNQFMNGAEGSSAAMEWKQLRPAEWPSEASNTKRILFLFVVDWRSELLSLSLIILLSSFFFHQTPQSGVSLIGLKKISLIVFIVGYDGGAAWLHSIIPEELSSFMLSFPQSLN